MIILKTKMNWSLVGAYNNIIHTYKWWVCVRENDRIEIRTVVTVVYQIDWGYGWDIEFLMAFDYGEWLKTTTFKWFFLNRIRIFGQIRFPIFKCSVSNSSNHFVDHLLWKYTINQPFAIRFNAFYMLHTEMYENLKCKPQLDLRSRLILTCRYGSSFHVTKSIYISPTLYRKMHFNWCMWFYSFLVFVFFCVCVCG